MFCNKCGKEVSDGATHCKSCGIALTETKPKIETKELLKELNASTIDEAKSMVSDAVGELVGKGKNAIIKYLAIAVVVLIAVIIAITAGVTSKPTINLDKYLTITTSGYNGYGKADVEIDWDAINKKYGKKIKFTKEFEEICQKESGLDLSVDEIFEMTGVTPLDFIIDGGVYVNIDKYDRLSNGDEINYNWEIDEDVEKYYKCKFKYKDGDNVYKVSGLTEVETFDAFEGMELEFSGVAPKATVKVVGSLNQTLSYIVDKSRDIANGDVITVTISNLSDNYDFERYIEKYNKVPETTTKEFVVEGVDEYVPKFAPIENEFYNIVKSDAEDEVYSILANGTSKDVTTSDVKYVGYIFTPTYNGNRVYLIYSVKATYKDQEKTGYMSVSISNILKSKDGLSYNISDVRGSGGYMKFETGSIFSYASVPCCNSKMECYNTITGYVGNNNIAYECGGEFEKFNNYKSLSNYSEINQEAKAEILTSVKNAIQKYADKNYNKDSQISDITEVGYYVLNSKIEKSRMDERNSLIVVCSATVSNTNGKFEPTTVYFPIKYDGVILFDDGSCSPIANASMCGYSDLGNGYSTNGYTDGTKMYNDLITKNRGNYTYTMTDGLKQFGE